MGPATLKAVPLVCLMAVLLATKMLNIPMRLLLLPLLKVQSPLLWMPVRSSLTLVEFSGIPVERLSTMVFLLWVIHLTIFS